MTTTPGAAAEEETMPSLAPELVRILAPDETASAYLRRTAALAAPVRTGLWFAPSLRPGQALELVGPSGSGKTAVLVQAAADALARGDPVLLLDADATFDVSRLASALRARATSGGSSGEGADEAVAAALSRFGLVSCHSSLELLSALVTLRASIERLSDAEGSRRCRLVLLDNAAAFYWPLRASAAAAARNARRRQASQPQPPHLTLATTAAASASALRRALKGSGAAAIVTRHAVFPTTATTEKLGGATTTAAKNEFFPQSWLSLASRRADLTPAGFSPASGGEERASRVRLTWRGAAAGGAGVASQPSTLLDLTDAGVVPSSS